MSRALLFATVLSGCTAFARGAAAADEPIFAHPAMDAGDPRDQLEVLLERIRSRPLDPGLTVYLAELREVWSLVPGAHERAAEALAEALAAARVHWNGDLLRSALAALHWNAGRSERARSLLSERGFLDGFLVCGPFGTATAAALRDPFPPEADVVAERFARDARYPRRRGAARWHVATRRPFGASIDTEGLLSGSGQVVYAVTHVRFEEAREGFLVYRGPSAKLWVNRSLAALLDRSQTRYGRSLRVPVRLRAGWNRIALKVAGGAPTAFSLRLCDRAGAPLHPLEHTVDPRPVPVASEAEPRAPYPSWCLWRLAREHPPQRRALYAWALMIDGLDAEAAAVLEDLGRSEPSVAAEPWFQLLFATAIERVDHLPRAVRRDRARRASERALERAPRSVRARQRLARYLAEDGKVPEAASLLEAILEDHPADVRSRLQLVELLERQNWTLEAEQALAPLAGGAFAEATDVLRARIRLLQRLGRWRAAQALREELLRREPGQTWVLAERARHALAAGNAEAARAAEEEYARRSFLDPADAADRRARACAASGERAGELAALRAAAEARPWDVERRLRLARRLAEEAADPTARDEAKALLDGVLAERPGLHAVRALRNALAGTEDRFWEEWVPPLDEVLSGAPDRSHWPKASTVCLLDLQVSKIYPDTSQVHVVHQVWRILDEAGVERYGSRPRVGELLELRTIAPTGEVLEPIRAGRGPFQMPGLAPGAVVEHAFKTRSGPASFPFHSGPFYFQDPDLTEPFWLSRWVLIVHKDAPVTLLERNMNRPGIRKHQEVRGDWAITVYEARNQPRIQPEPNMPGRDEILPWVKVVERRRLEDLGAFYRSRAAGPAAKPSVARKAAELTFGLGSDLEKARALYAFCQEHVKSQEGSSDPAGILAARAGSKTALFLALLAAAEVPHHLLLAAPQPGDAVDWEQPEVSVFRVPVVRLEPAGQEPVYLFPQAHRLAPFGSLPRALWNAPAYVCDVEGGALDVVPGKALGSLRHRGLRVFRLRGDGSARVRVRKVLPGLGFYRLKEVFGALPERRIRGWFAQQAARVAPGARLLSWALPHREEPEVPLSVEFELEAEGFLSVRPDGRVELRRALEPTHLKPRFAAQLQRRFPLLLTDPAGVGAQLRDEVRVELGPFACPRPPRGVTLQTRFGHFSLDCRLEGSLLRIERSLLLRPGRIAPADYGDFRAFLDAIDRAERTPIVLERRER
ncbi:MAG: hypothetical protein D6731_00920 [Planctomycetota bacterium]|nr:MAG: hypothetical protein D6731_00920 [Planctomycetota bacterium]